MRIDYISVGLILSHRLLIFNAKDNHTTILNFHVRQNVAHKKTVYVEMNKFYSSWNYNNEDFKNKTFKNGNTQK